LNRNTSCFLRVSTAVFDPRRCQRSWRAAWRKLTTAARLQGFRFHDCRHHAITELAESQASDATIIALAGHVSRKMLEHYSHVRQQAKREAVNVLSANRPNQPTMKGYDTNQAPPDQVPLYCA
jgi:integrase